MLKKIGVVVITVAALALAGCGTHRSTADPAPGNQNPGRNSAVIIEPHGFRNVMFTCFGTVGVYVTSAGADDTLPSGIAVLPSDPHCAS